MVINNRYVGGRAKELRKEMKKYRLKESSEVVKI
jgi:hypothetical protein